MPVMEHISIINKSGKVVGTSKHLVNIFKDAKDAYQERKAEIKIEYRQRADEKAARKMLQTVTLDQRAMLEQAPRSPGAEGERRHRRPPLTERNSSYVSASGTRRSSSRRGSVHSPPHSPRSPRSPHSSYQAPYFENGDISRPDLNRTQTEYLGGSELAPIPRGFRPPFRTRSSPAMYDDVDMHLAYGELPPQISDPTPAATQEELNGLMSKLDSLMMEAQCVQHSATTIMTSLQKNPEAMAAVALTLAEISNVLAKMSPGIITALKAGSPAVFALLASPQFLIAGGMAVGVTIVMFGGYKIIKKIQATAAINKEANRMDEALAYHGEVGSIESWRRGVNDIELQSVATSVSGEFITPEADRLRKDKIRQCAREERPRSRTGEGVSSSLVKVDKKERKKDKKDREVLEKKEREREAREAKARKPNALVVLFSKKNAREGRMAAPAPASVTSHRQPRIVEI